MKYKQLICAVKSNEMVALNIFDMKIQFEDNDVKFMPGQFIHILCGDKMLRRPISICDIDEDNKLIRILYEVKGEGTSWLSQADSGDELDVIGPLGNGFPIENNYEKVMLIGGGIGTPPLLYAGKFYGKKSEALLGFRGVSNAVLIEEFKQTCSQTLIATDDGTLGKKGFVTDLLLKRLEESTPEAIFTCGPTVMMSAVSKIAADRGIKCYASLEERMACGIGACLGCAVEVKRGNKINYLHVCKDGPVFDAEEVFVK